MKFLKTVSHAALAVMLVTAAADVAGVALVAPAHAAKNQVSSKVGKPLLEAQAALKSGNASGAIAKLREADAMSGKKPYDNYVINSLMTAAATRLGDEALMIKSANAVINSGQASAAEKRSYGKIILQANFAQGRYKDVISGGEAFLRANGQDSDVIALIAESQMRTGNLKGAEAYIKQAINAKGGSPNLYDALISVQYKIGGNNYAMPTMVTKLSKYPSPDSWGKVIDIAQKSSGVSDGISAEFWRLKAATGSLSDRDYVSAAKQLMVVRLYADATKLLEKGKAKGIVGVGPAKDRELKLLETASAQAAKDKAGIDAIGAAAAKSPSGTPLVQAGSIARNVGAHDKAISLTKAGLAKGGIKSKEEGQLMLGIAQIEGGKKADGRKTLAGIKGNNAAAALAKLYLLNAG